MVVNDVPGSSLVLKGSGVATISGGVFDPTPATWALAATGSGPVTFGFVAGSSAIPDGGNMTVMLLGVALCGLALFRQKVMA